jgi:hypothetical protein
VAGLNRVGLEGGGAFPPPPVRLADVIERRPFMIGRRGQPQVGDPPRFSPAHIETRRSSHSERRSARQAAQRGIQMGIRSLIVIGFVAGITAVCGHKGLFNIHNQLMQVTKRNTVPILNWKPVNVLRLGRVASWWVKQPVI